MEKRKKLAREGAALLPEGDRQQFLVTLEEVCQKTVWDQPGAGRQFGLVMEARRRGELEQEFQPVRRGWCVGSEQFRELLYVQEHSRLEPPSSGQPTLNL